MNILLFSPIITHPQNEGNSKRIYNFGKYLQELGHEVHFVYFPLGKFDQKNLDAMQSEWDSFTYIENTINFNYRNGIYPLDIWYQDNIHTIVNNLIGVFRIDTVCVDYIIQSKLLEYVPKHIVKIIDTLDIFAERHLLFDNHQVPYTWYSISKEDEIKGLERADMVLAIQEKETRYFSELVDREIFTVGHLEKEKYTDRKYTKIYKIGFVGSPNEINVYSINEFLEAFFKNTPTKEVEIHIAGSVCNKIKKRHPNLKLHGVIDDLGNFYNDIDLIINPLLFGTGLKIKTIEALSYGVPMISTKIGFDGIKSSELCHQADTINDMVICINSIVSGNIDLQDLANKSREIFKNYINATQESIRQVFNQKNIIYSAKQRDQSILKVGHITFTSKGGAGIATKRLHVGLSDLNINSYLLTLDRDICKQDNVYYIEVPRNQNFDLVSLSNRNIHPGNTIFSLSYPSISFKLLDVLIKNNDIINLHWIPRILSTEAIAYLSHSNTPIVWTFHDKNPLTGGCHYFHGCDKWKTDCRDCPQLIDNYDNYPAKVLAAKKKYINFKNITVVVLNQHFKSLVEQSPLFNESRIEVIPNSIDTDRFMPLDKKQTREKLGLSADKKSLLYVAAYASTIKGYKEFEETVAAYEKRYGSEGIEILLVGNLPKERDIKLPFKEFGHIDEDKIIELYSASDLTVLSSIEDNLPNVILESFSCGTPIVGFKIGGLPDMIQDGYNGYTVELGDIEGLAESIHKVLDGKNLSKNCRAYAEENLRLDIQAQRHKALYEDLLSKPVEATGEQDKIPEIFPETAPTVARMLNEMILSKDTKLKQSSTHLKQRDTQLKQKDTQLKQKDTQLKKLSSDLIVLKNNKWYRFGKKSYKIKIWTIGKIVSKKLKITRSQ